MNLLGIFGILCTSIASITAQVCMEAGCEIWNSSPNGIVAFQCCGIDGKQIEEYAWPVQNQAKDLINKIGRIELWFYSIEFDDRIIPQQFFESKYQTHVLHFFNLDVIYIAENAFNTSTFSTVTGLTFSNMPIGGLPEGAFNGLPELTEIIFDQVPLHIFGTEVLIPCTKIEKVQIRSSGHEKLWVDGVGDLKSVKTLMLTGNNMTGTITRTAFKAFTKLTYLYLSRNQIEYIYRDAFDDLFRTLVYLDLSFNRLKTLQPRVFEKAPLILGYNMQINLVGNPWHCDCELEGLRMYVSGMTPVHSFTFCKSPKSVQGKEFGNLGNLCLPMEGLQVDEEGMPLLINYPNDDIPTKRPIQVSCKLPDAPYFLTMNQFIGRIGLEMFKREMYLNINEFPPNFVVIAYQQNSTEGGSIEIFGKHICITNNIGNQIRNVKLKPKLEQGNIYRFCLLHKMSHHVLPLNCRTYYDGITISRRQAWMMASDRVLVGFLCFFVGFSMFAIGLFAAIPMNEYLPKRFCGVDFSTRIEPPMELKTIKPINRKITRMPSKFRSKAFDQEFEDYDSAGYITLRIPVSETSN